MSFFTELFISREGESNTRPTENFVLLNPLQSVALPTELSRDMCCLYFFLVLVYYIFCFSLKAFRVCAL